MEQGEHSGGKKAKVDASPAAHPANQEAEMRRGVGGGSTAMSVGTAAAEHGSTSRPRVNLSFDESKLHCPRCHYRLKPPILQCDAGHLACGDCHAIGPISSNNSKCHTCGLDYFRNPVLEDFILSAGVSCRNEAYCCTSYIPYVLFYDQKRACPFAPCCCPEQGCTFEGSPGILIDHIVAAHPVVDIRYGEEVVLSLTLDLCWLALVGEDRSLFILKLVESGKDTAVSLVCVRDNSGAPAAPQYWCRLRAEVYGGGGDGDEDEEWVVMESKVRSSWMPGAKSMPDQRAFLGVYYPVPEDEAVALSIRIDLLQPAAGAENAAGTTRGDGGSSPGTTNPQARSSSNSKYPPLRILYTSTTPGWSIDPASY